MKKTGIIAALLAAILLLPAPARGEGALSFGEDGTFTLLVLSDVEERPSVSPYYSSTLSRLLEEERPDLVVLLGDQLQGDHWSYGRGDPKTRAQDAISGILSPLAAAKIPFVPVLGGGDLATGLSREELLGLYGESTLCLRRGSEAGYCLTLSPWQGEETCLNLFFFDEAGLSGDRGPAGVGAEQVDWFMKQSGEREDSLGNLPPAVSFAHTILPEIYQALTPAQRAGKDTLTGPEGIGYERDSESILLGVMNEASAIPRENPGLLSAFSQAGNVFLSVSGNNHTNAFLTAVEGVDLLASPSASYTARSDRALRGGWLIRFYEENVEDYELRFVPFAEYENLENGGWLVYALSTWFILSRDAKAGIFIGILVLCIGLALLLGKKQRNRKPEPEEMPEGPEADWE